MQINSSGNGIAQLNLARKWRSKKFNQIIGQDLSVRLIKNGLYRNLIFPVYLLSGTRGCGKTTMGRLFAAALNCDQLLAFQKNPQTIELPCLECLSCKTMQQAAHPDFIELDAASNTGVDTIRQLIEGSSFSPIMGQKKIYLIDEAHMLSKAAFNALLKVLEEPPMGVVFLLATTDPHKIIDTVRSRCFQLFFSPLKPQELVAHLAFICTEEKIAYETEALVGIAHETEGSVRDAINLLERVRLVQSKITQESVAQTLGFCTEEKIITLFQAIVAGNSVELLSLVEEYALAHFDVALLWKKLVELIRISLWLYVGVEPTSSFLSIDRIKSLLAKTSYERLVKLLEICYEHELAFSKTSLPHVMFEMLLLKLVIATGTTSAPIGNPAESRSESRKPVLAIPVAQVPLKQEPIKQEQRKQEPVKQGPWQDFLELLDKLEDPLVTSIFKQARFVAFLAEKNEIQLAFATDVLFFKEWLGAAEKSWKPMLVKAFGAGANCVLQFTDAAQIKAPPVRHTEISEPKVTPKPAAESRPFTSYNKPAYAGQAPTSREMSIDVKDASRWGKTNMILKLFPGTVTQIM